MPDFEINKPTTRSSYGTNLAEVVEVGDPRKSHKVYPQRFLMLAIFAFGSIMSGYPFEQLAIISDVAKIYYGVNDLLLEWTAMIFMIGYIVGTYPGIWLFRKYGLRIGFLTGMVGTSVGFWINCVAVHRDRFWVAMIGQATMAVFQPAFLNVGPMVSYTWFGEKEVSKACSVAVMSNIVGSALGTLIPPLIVTSKDMRTVEQQMLTMFFTQAAVCTGGTIVAIILFREKPPTPPCMAQEKLEEVLNRKSENSEVFTDTIKMMKNPRYFLAVIPYGISYGLWSSMLTVLNQQILSIYPSAEMDLGYLGLLYQFSGCAGMFVFGALLDRTRKYKQLSLILYVGVSLTIAVYTIDITVELLAVYISFGLCGFFVVAYLSFGLELTVKICYPVPEITSSSSCVFFGNVITLGMVYVVGLLLNNYGTLVANQLLVLFAITGLFLLGLLNMKPTHLKETNDAVYVINTE